MSSDYLKLEGATLSLSGAVGREQVVELRARGELLLAGYAGSRLTLDLGESTALDSSLVALLLAWLRCARGRGLTLELSNCPQSLLQLLELYGLDQLSTG